MRPPLAIIALGLLLAAPAAAQLSEPHVVRPSAAPCLNVRPEPDTDTEPETCIPPGTAVTVIGSVPYWREIRLDDASTGWAAKKFLEPATTPTTPAEAVTIPADAFLEVHFVDVGQGDAIWIHTMIGNAHAPISRTQRGSEWSETSAASFKWRISHVSRRTA